jgi:hypothetical protein
MTISEIRTFEIELNSMLAIVLASALNSFDGTLKPQEREATPLELMMINRFAGMLLEFAEQPLLEEVS